MLNGQKVWTTNAQFAAYGLLLARTDPEQHKHKGLTMFVLPMDAEGVTVRGLRQISGEAEFNEVFLDDVRLPADAVVGQVNDGWRTALTTLMFERVTIGLGSEGMGYKEDRFARAIAADAEARRDPEVRKRLGEIGVDLLAIKFTGYRTLTALAKGQIPGPEAGLAKVTTVNAAIAAGELIADVLGPDALDEDGEWAYMISFLPGLKSAGGTEEILRNTIGERVLGLPPEPRLDKGVPVQRAARQGEGGGGRMNLALSDEQEFLREAARGALSRVKTIEAAREALEGGALPDLWPTVVEAGWPGPADRRGPRRRRARRLRRDARGAGVRPRARRRAAARAAARQRAAAGRRRRVAGGRGRGRRAPGVAARAPARRPRRRAGPSTPRARQAPRAGAARDGRRRQRELHRRGRLGARRARRRPARRRRRRRAGAPGRGRRRRRRRAGRGGHALRRHPLARPRDARRRRPAGAWTSTEEQLARAWYLAQALLAAESLGAVETALEMAVQYAKERFTFGRAIGSYQAIKHGLTEVLRRQENARSLLYYAGWAFDDQPEQFALAASAARSAAGSALDFAARQNIVTHGGIGATWEHDAPLFFRRAQLCRRLLGGAGDATDRVAAELLAAA